jgi:hypothetical protein
LSPFIHVHCVNGRGDHSGGSYDCIKTLEAKALFTMGLVDAKPCWASLFTCKSNENIFDS